MISFLVIPTNKLAIPSCSLSVYPCINIICRLTNEDAIVSIIGCHSHAQSPNSLPWETNPCKVRVVFSKPVRVRDCTETIFSAQCTVWCNQKCPLSGYHVIMPITGIKQQGPNSAWVAIASPNLGISCLIMHTTYTLIHTCLTTQWWCWSHWDLHLHPHSAGEAENWGCSGRLPVHQVSTHTTCWTCPRSCKELVILLFVC